MSFKQDKISCAYQPAMSWIHHYVFSSLSSLWFNLIPFVNIDTWEEWKWETLSNKTGNCCPISHFIRFTGKKAFWKECAQKLHLHQLLFNFRIVSKWGKYAFYKNSSSFIFAFLLLFMLCILLIALNKLLFVEIRPHKQYIFFFNFGET